MAKQIEDYKVKKCMMEAMIIGLDMMGFSHELGAHILFDHFIPYLTWKDEYKEVRDQMFRESIINDDLN